MSAIVHSDGSVHRRQAVANAQSDCAIDSPKTTLSPLRYILIPLNIPVQNCSILSFAAHWAEYESGTIYLLHVVDDRSFGLREVDFPLFRAPQDQAALAHRYLRALAHQQVPSSVPVRILVRQGQTALEVIKAAKEIGADLIILQGRPKNWLSRWLPRDLVHDIEIRSPCSVVTLR